MRRRGLDPNSYRHAVIFVNVTDPVTNEFLRERIGIAHLNEVYDTQVPGAIWQVRYFRDSQAEEYSIKLKPDGTVVAVHHRVPREAAGASLSKEEAIAKAEKFLREEKKIDLGQWTLVAAESDKRDHRTDHELTWQQKAPLDADSASSASGTDHAYIRMKVAVLGDEAVDYWGNYYSKPEAREEQEQKEGETLWNYIKIPEEWRRKQEEQTLPRSIVNYAIPILFLVGGGILILIIFLKNLRSETAQAIPWKRLSRWALWGLAAFLATFALSDRIPLALNMYDTATPLKTTLGILGIGVFLGGAFNWGFVALLFGAAWYYAKRAFGDEQLPGWLGMPGDYYRDALFIGLGGAGAMLGLRTSLQTALQHWPSAHRFAEASFGSNFDAIQPAGASLGMNLGHALVLTGTVALLGSFVTSHLRARWLRFLAFLIGSMSLVAGNWGSPQDFMKQWLAEAIFLAVVIFGVSRVVRFNILGCFLVLAILALVHDGLELLAQPDGYYRASGYAVMLVLMLVLAWPFVSWRRRASQAG